MRLQRRLEPVAVCLPQLRLQGPLTLGISDSGSGAPPWVEALEGLERVLSGR